MKKIWKIVTGTAVFTILLTIFITWFQQILIGVILPILGYKMDPLGLDKDLKMVVLIPAAVIFSYVVKNFIHYNAEKARNGIIAMTIFGMCWYGTNFCIKHYWNPQHAKNTEEMLIDDCQINWFGPDGQSLFWYGRDTEGWIHVFPVEGHFPWTGEKLQPLTAEIIQEICQQIEVKKTKAAQLEEAKQKEAAAQAERDRLTLQDQAKVAAAQMERDYLLKKKQEAEAQNQLSLRQRQEAEANAKALQEQNAALQAKLAEEQKLKLEPTKPKANNLGTNYITATCNPPLKPYFPKDDNQLSCCQAPGKEIVNCVIPNLANFCARVMTAGVPATDLGENCCRNEQTQGCFTLFNNDPEYTEIPNVKLPKFCIAQMRHHSSSYNSVAAPDLGPNCCRNEQKQGCFTISKGHTAEFTEIPKEVRQPTATPEPAQQRPSDNGLNIIEFQFSTPVSEYASNFYTEVWSQAKTPSPTLGLTFTRVPSGSYYVNFRSQEFGWMIAELQELKFTMAYRVNGGNWVQVNSRSGESIHLIFGYGYGFEIIIK